MNPCDKFTLFVDVIQMAPDPDSKVHGAIMGPIWGRQDPGGPHAGPVNFASGDPHMVALVRKCD